MVEVTSRGQDCSQMVAAYLPGARTAEYVINRRHTTITLGPGAGSISLRRVRPARCIRCADDNASGTAGGH